MKQGQRYRNHQSQHGRHQRCRNTPGHHAGIAGPEQGDHLERGDHAHHGTQQSKQRGHHVQYLDKTEPGFDRGRFPQDGLIELEFQGFSIRFRII